MSPYWFAIGGDLAPDRVRFAEAGEWVPQRHPLDAREGATGEQQSIAELADADEHDGQPQAADVLVGAQGDGQQGHGRPCEQPHDDGSHEAQPGIAGVEGGSEAEEGTRVHGALDPEVEDAGALRVRLADGAVDERRGVAEGGGDDVGEERHVGDASEGG